MGKIWGCVPTAAVAYIQYLLVMRHALLLLQHTTYVIPGVLFHISWTFVYATEKLTELNDCSKQRMDRLCGDWWQHINFPYTQAIICIICIEYIIYISYIYICNISILYISNILLYVSYSEEQIWRIWLSSCLLPTKIDNPSSLILLSGLCSAMRSSNQDGQ